MVNRALGPLVIVVAFSAFAYPRVDEVTVKKVMDDKAIVVRSNGDTYLIEKGVGCLSLWRFEGRKVLVSSPGLFLGVGSRLLLPDADQSCRIWNAELLETSTTPLMKPWAPPPSPTASSDSLKKKTVALQRALLMAGYDPGPVDGNLSAKTTDALDKFRLAKGHDSSSAGLQLTFLDLATVVLNKKSAPPDQLTLADELIAMAEPPRNPTRSGCEDGHWVKSISEDGEVVILEDGSVWEIDAVDRIDTMLWLPTEQILTCSGYLINTDNGEKVAASQVK